MPEGARVRARDTESGEGSMRERNADSDRGDVPHPLALHEVRLLHDFILILTFNGN